MKEKLKLWLEGLESTVGPDEFEAKNLVKLYGVPVPEGRVIRPVDSLDLEGLTSPFALKVCSGDILHKTELKGVILNNDKVSVKKNLDKLRKRFPGRNILVENQAGFSGPEFIVGIVKDPALGHAVMVGAGGVLTEVLKDTSFRLVPCSVKEAGEMIDELIISQVFDNFRGMALDRENLARTISLVSKLAQDLGDRLNQLDINPVVFSKGEWTALDVMIVLE